MLQRTTAAVRGWDFPRSAASVLLMLRFAGQRGVEPERMLRGSALTSRQVHDPDSQIDAHQELAVVRNLLAEFDDPGLGVEVGSRYQITTFGIFGFACVSSPTLADVIAFVLRYWELSFAFGIPEITSDGAELRLRLHDEQIPGDVRSFLVERDLAAMVTISTSLRTGPVVVHRARFRHRQPASIAGITELLGVRPRYESDANEVVLDAGVVDEPLPQGNPETVAMCEAQCAELVARRRTRSGIAHDVRQRLVRLGGVDTGMDAVAGQLGLSTRTLRRRLTEAGTSYRALLDEVRAAIAEEMLATRALSVSDVAVRLGYADATSFIAAFKRWTGSTPAAYLRGRR